LDNTIFENERYYITTCDLPVEQAVSVHGGKYTYVYAVVNKVHEVPEVFTPSYPDAVAAAEQLDIACANEVWKWSRIQSDADAMEVAAGSPPDVH
jgi:hypothetical protein